MCSAAPKRPPSQSRSDQYAQAREQLHQSLERLQVDSVDLIQLHALGHPDDWDVAMRAGGALEAVATPATKA